MSVPNFQLIRDSLSLINMYRVGEEVEPEHSEFALRKLNQLMEDWRVDGVDLQYYAQTMNDLADDCPIPADAELAVTHYLAIACAPHFARPVTPELSALADKYYSRLTRVAVEEQVQPADLTNLPMGEGHHGLFDITNG